MKIQVRSLLLDFEAILKVSLEYIKKTKGCPGKAVMLVVVWDMRSTLMNIDNNSEMSIRSGLD